jgi:asparagine synthase (glutamine-hydrolysing)
MCGIAGIVAADLGTEHLAVLRRMTDAIAHRGPDGEGQRRFRECALGHRRLAIVDLASGTQPMATSDDQVAVTFNGEIYGYKELRRSLGDFPFRTQSDTEVILALYERHGAGLLDRLPGMFAFGLWDDRRRVLFCARDRFGEKPFYYAFGRRGEFLFASEIKAILASGLVEPALDMSGVARYLQRQCVRPDQSIYSNIHALPPGHSLSWRDGRVEVRQYWTPPAIDDDINAADAEECFRSLLAKAVERQLVADVPVGAFLSGGLDSSTVCLVAARLAEGLRTFSFDFEGDHSEVPYARAVADACRTRHVELAAGGEDMGAHLIRMQQVFDEPMGDTSSIPTYLLAREARRHTKVALTGDGGDELFGGYTWYKPLLWMVREGRTGMLRFAAERTLNRLHRACGMPGAVARELRIMGLAFGRRYGSPLAAHQAQLSFFEQRDLEKLGLAPSAAPADAGTMDDAIRSDVTDYMPANNLTRTDRASMAHGLELRAPFLDFEFASFCMSLPFRLKVSTNEDKIILRRAFASQWPALIRNRSKQGFGAPLARWLKDPAIRQIEQSHLLDRRAPIFDVLPFGATHEVLRRGSPMQRWTLLILAVWLAHRSGTADFSQSRDIRMEAAVQNA